MSREFTFGGAASTTHHTTRCQGGSGASKITGDVASILAQLPTVVEGISGVDLKKLIEKLPEALQGDKGGRLEEIAEATVKEEKAKRVSKKEKK